MKILICDAERLAVEELTDLLSQLGHEVVAIVSDGKHIVDWVQRDQPDILIIDIQVPGFDVLLNAKCLSRLKPMPAVIFYTACTQQVLDPIRRHAEGCLTKPTSLRELQQVFHSLTKLDQAQMTNLEKKQSMEKIAQRQQIVAKTYRGVELIPTENIYYFQADQKYVAVRHKNGSVLIDETLKELEQEFADKFIRIHRNALISLDYLDGLELITSGQYQARCREIEERLAVSRRHLPILREKMHSL